MSTEEVPVSFREKKEFIDKIDKECEKRGIPRSESCREGWRLWLYGFAWPLMEAREKMMEDIAAILAPFSSIERAAAKIEGTLGKEGENHGEK